MIGCGGRLQLCAESAPAPHVRTIRMEFLFSIELYTTARLCGGGRRTYDDGWRGGDVRRCADRQMRSMAARTRSLVSSARTSCACAGTILHSHSRRVVGPKGAGMRARAFDPNSKYARNATCSPLPPPLLPFYSPTIAHHRKSSPHFSQSRFTHAMRVQHAHFMRLI